MTYTLVSAKEADLKTGKISVESPIGKGLLGKVVGDVAEVQVPNGKIKFEIEKFVQNMSTKSRNLTKKIEPFLKKMEPFLKKMEPFVKKMEPFFEKKWSPF